MQPTSQPTGQSLYNNWIQTSVEQALWQKAVFDSTGSILVAVSSQAGIFLSSNTGFTFTKLNAPVLNYISLAASSNTSYMLAAPYGGASLQFSKNYGSNWMSIPITSVPIQSFTEVTMSNSGAYMASCSDFKSQNSGYIYISSSYGTTWSQASTAKTLSYWSIAMSSSGKFIVATTGYGSIFTSSSYGFSWQNTNAPNGYWYSVSMSKSGNFSTAVQINGGIFYSTNFGFNWTDSNAPSSVGYGWFGVASDSSGKNLLAAGNRSRIFSSSTYGKTWAQTSSPDGPWTSVAMSSNAKIVAATSTYIYVDNELREPSSRPTSQPSVTLSSIMSFYLSPGNPGIGWYSVVSDSTGLHLVSAQSGGYIYTSTDYGQTWNRKTSVPSKWSAVATSGYGKNIVALQLPGFVYIR